MKLSIYPKRNFILTGFFLTMVSLYPMHADMSYMGVNNMDELLHEVSYLDVSEKARSVIDFEYKKGTFSKIEYGCFQSLTDPDSWKFFFYSWLLCAEIVAWLWLKEYEGRPVIPVDRLGNVMYTFVLYSFIALITTFQLYSAAEYKEYSFITDKGLLLIDQRGMVFQRYEDLVTVQLIKRPHVLVSSPWFGRIIDKQGEFFDFLPDQFVSEVAFLSTFEYLDQKIKKERKRGGEGGSDRPDSFSPAKE